MLNLPVTPDTFKKAFLRGDGLIEISSDQDAWRNLFESDKAFTKDVDQIADVKFGVGGSQPLTLGRADTIKIGVSTAIQAVHQIQLIWPDSTVEPSLFRGLNPDAKQVLVRFFVQGSADVSAKGSAPIGPLKNSFGLTAGAVVSLERLQLYPADTSARHVLEDTFAGFCLPQQTDALDRVPDKNEVLVAKFGGYLTVSGQVSYGYSMTGSKEIEIGKLNLDLDYRLKLLAGVGTSFKIAGDFELEARAANRQNFVRYVVRKSRHSEFNFAADIGFDADVHLKGLPDTCDEFLAKAFGASTESILGLFDKARKYADVNELEQAAGKIAKGSVRDLSQTLIGKALTNTTLSDFVSKMRQLVEAYNETDARIVHLYEDSLENLPALTKTLNLLTSVTSKDGLRNIPSTDTSAWRLIHRLAGGKLYEILLEEGEFADFANRLKSAKSFIEEDAAKELRDVIQRLKEGFALNGLFEQLKGINTPDQLKNLADERLQGLVEQLLARSFEDIRNSAVAKTIHDLRDGLDKVEAFKTKFYKKAIEVANRSYSAQLHFAYARASSDKALLDVEVDVSTDVGQRLARLAAGGDFQELLSAYSSRIVRINQGVFTHSLTTSTHLQINLFGFGIEKFTSMFQRTEESLEAHDGGLLHIYTTETQLEERRKHGGELTASSFMLASVTEALQVAGSRDYLVRTLPKMSVQYDLTKEDDKTKPDEMRGILDLAQCLGIVDAVRFTDALRQQFPAGLGQVSAKYVVRYDSAAVAAAFQIKDGPKRENLRTLVVDTLRTFIASKYTAMPNTHAMALLGFAYASPQTFDLFRTLGFATFQNSSISITLPSWFTKGAPNTVLLEKQHKANLVTLYDIERKFVDRLVELDQTIDGLRDGTTAVSAKDLHKKIKQFIEMADDLNFGRENSFFIVFDRLAMEGSGGRIPRNSALILEITPPGGEKVTKVLTGVVPAVP